MLTALATRRASEGAAPEARPAAAAPQGPAADTVPPTPDAVLACMALVCELHGQPIGTAALAAGFAVGPDGRVPPQDMPALAAAHGLSAGWLRRDLARIDSLALPVIVLLKDGSACVLLQRPDADSGRGGECAIARPDTGTARLTLPWHELLDSAAGPVLYVKPRAQVDGRGDFTVDVPPTRWFWSLLWRYKRYYTHVALATVIVNLLTLAGSFFTLHVYDRVVPNQAYSTLWVLAVGTVLAAGFEMGARMLRAWMTDVAGKKADLVMSAYLFRRVMGLRLDQRPASAGSFANTLRDFESVRDIVASATLLTVADLPFVLLFVAVIGLVAGPLAWVPIIAMGVVLLATALAQIPMGSLMSRYMQGMSRKQAIAVEAIDALEVLRAHRAEGLMQGRWEDSNAAMATFSAKSRLLSAWLMSISSLAQQLATVAMVTWGVYRIHEGLLTLGGLIAAVILMGRAVAPISQLTQLGMRFQHARSALKSLNGLMRLAQERDSEKTYLPLPSAQGALGFSQVSHRYNADQPTPSLQGISLQVRAGERVAILGKVGSGKSTLLRVAAGLLPAKEGGVTLDGLDLRQIEPADMRQHVAYLGQDARLIYGTLRENILMGDTTVSAPRLAEALRITGLDKVVAAHPKGLDLPIGENGLGLSGGQRQLVALARLVVRDPRVVLLDEPTSAMDQMTENQIMANLQPWARQRTVIMVTHRGQWLGLVDRIVVMDAGRIVADGPREQVLAQLTKGIAVAPVPSNPA